MMYHVKLCTLLPDDDIGDRRTVGLTPVDRLLSKNTRGVSKPAASAIEMCTYGHSPLRQVLKPHQFSLDRVGSYVGRIWLYSRRDRTGRPASQPPRHC